MVENCAITAISLDVIYIHGPLWPDRLPRTLVVLPVLFLATANPWGVGLVRAKDIH